jgi:hypothetical protein
VSETPSVTEDVHPRDDAVQVIAAALSFLDCPVPVDPYDPEDIGSVASEAVWALIRAGILTETAERNGAAVDGGRRRRQ